MAVVNRIAAFHDEMTAWRRDLHRHPELGFEEHRTAALVADRLRSFGVDEVHTGVARTGVVGVLRGKGGGGSAGEAIGLRADMDALPIREATGKDHASRNEGVMHACGHDGHTTMLLGAARYLAETRNFAGTVYLIFQPAEEMLGGGEAMVREGLFERFPMRRVFGLHNWPGLPVDSFAIRPGPLMAASDRFDIVVTGRGTHAAMPQLGRDPVLAAAHLVLALQAIVAREVAPAEQAVVSVTEVHGGDAYNVIPPEVTLRGTARSFTPEVRDLIERRMAEVAAGVAATLGVTARLAFERGYPPTVNHEAETDLAAEAAAEVVGAANVDRDPTPRTGAEDFAYMLEARPGSYILMGNGPADGERMLHNPNYDFNDESLPVGASYWARLVERLLPAA